MVLGQFPYLYLTVAFIQMLKAFSPAYMVVLLSCLGVEYPSNRVKAVVLGLCVSAAVASAGEVHQRSAMRVPPCACHHRSTRSQHTEPGATWPGRLTPPHRRSTSTWWAYCSCLAPPSPTRCGSFFHRHGPRSPADATHGVRAPRVQQWHVAVGERGGARCVWRGGGVGPLMNAGVSSQQMPRNDAQTVRHGTGVRSPPARTRLSTHCPRTPDAIARVPLRLLAECSCRHC